MGIANLTSYLIKKGEAYSYKKGDIVLVDAYAIIFSLISAHAGHDAFLLQFPDYQELLHPLRLFCLHYWELGVDIRFYFDAGSTGEALQRKSETHGKREAEKIETAAQAFDVAAQKRLQKQFASSSSSSAQKSSLGRLTVMSPSSSSPSARSFVHSPSKPTSSSPGRTVGQDWPRTLRPAFCSSQAKQLLKDLGVPIVICNGEADFTLAADAARLKAIVLSSDSDFFLLPKPGRFVVFNQDSALEFLLAMQEKELGQESDSVADALSGRVSIHSLANSLAVLGLKEASAPLLSAILGNDYTHHLTSTLIWPRLNLMNVKPSSARVEAAVRIANTPTSRLPALAALLEDETFFEAFTFTAKVMLEPQSMTSFDCESLSLPSPHAEAFLIDLAGRVVLDQAPSEALRISASGSLFSPVIYEPLNILPASSLIRPLQLAFMRLCGRLDGICQERVGLVVSSVGLSREICPLTPYYPVALAYWPGRNEAIQLLYLPLHVYGCVALDTCCSTIKLFAGPRAATSPKNRRSFVQLLDTLSSSPAVRSAALINSLSITHLMAACAAYAVPLSPTEIATLVMHAFLVQTNNSAFVSAHLRSLDMELSRSEISIELDQLPALTLIARLEAVLRRTKALAQLLQLFTNDEHHKDCDLQSPAPTSLVSGPLFLQIFCLMRRISGAGGRRVLGVRALLDSFSSQFLPSKTLMAHEEASLFHFSEMVNWPLARQFHRIVGFHEFLFGLPEQCESLMPPLFSQGLLHNFLPDGTDEPEEDAAATAASLPIAQHREEIVSAVKNNKVVVIEAETGAGKSSQVPQYLMDEEGTLPGNRNGLIVVTQPRRIAAIGLAERVAKERGGKTGGEVGFAIGNDAKRSKRTRLLFVTTGWLLNKLLFDDGSFFSRLEAVILDEIHERSLDQDFLSLVIKRLWLGLQDRNTVTPQLILMSATLNAELFLRYFEPLNVIREKKALRLVSRTHPVPSLFVGVRRFPVTDVHLDELLSYVGGSIDPAFLSHLIGKFSGGIRTTPSRLMDAVSDKLYELVFHLCRLEADKSSSPAAGTMVSSGGGTCILVFCPGVAVIEDLHALFVEYADPRFEVLLLHSLMEHTDQMRVFDPIPRGKTRVICSTNIAESSVTISNVTTVIDFGLERQIRRLPNSQVASLVTQWTSRASATQRSGRCGRVCPGTCFRLYPRLLFETSFLAYDEPEIIRLSLASTVLKMKVISSAMQDNESKFSSISAAKKTQSSTKAMAKFEFKMIGDSSSTTSSTAASTAPAAAADSIFQFSSNAEGSSGRANETAGKDGNVATEPLFTYEFGDANGEASHGTPVIYEAALRDIRRMFSNPAVALGDTIQPPKRATVIETIAYLVSSGAMNVGDTLRSDMSRLQGQVNEHEMKLLTGPEYDDEFVDDEDDELVEAEFEVSMAQDAQRLCKMSVSFLDGLTTEAQITGFGRLLAEIPLDLSLSRLVCVAARTDRFLCHGIVIAVGFSLMDAFVKPHPAAAFAEFSQLSMDTQSGRHYYDKRRDGGDGVHQLDEGLRSDGLSLLRIYSDFCTREGAAEYRTRKFAVNAKRMKTLARTVAEIARSLQPLLPERRAALQNLVDGGLKAAKAVRFNDDQEADFIRMMIAIAFCYVKDSSAQKAIRAAKKAQCFVADAYSGVPSGLFQDLSDPADSISSVMVGKLSWKNMADIPLAKKEKETEKKEEAEEGEANLDGFKLTLSKIPSKLLTGGSESLLAALQVSKKQAKVRIGAVVQTGESARRRRRRKQTTLLLQPWEEEAEAAANGGEIDGEGPAQITFCPADHELAAAAALEREWKARLALGRSAEGYRVGDRQVTIANTDSQLSLPPIGYSFLLSLFNRGTLTVPSHFVRDRLAELKKREEQQLPKNQKKNSQGKMSNGGGRFAKSNRGGGADDDEDDLAFVIKEPVRSAKIGWSFGSGVKAVIDERSVSAVLQPRSKLNDGHLVYAVPGSTMVIGQRGNVVRAEKLTVLENERGLLSLFAMTCQGLKGDARKLHLPSVAVVSGCSSERWIRSVQLPPEIIKEVVFSPQPGASMLENELVIEWAATVAGLLRTSDFNKPEEKFTPKFLNEVLRSLRLRVTNAPPHFMREADIVIQGGRATRAQKSLVKAKEKKEKVKSKEKAMIKILQKM